MMLLFGFPAEDCLRACVGWTGLNYGKYLLKNGKMGGLPEPWH